MKKTAGLIEYSKKKMALRDASKLGRLLQSGAQFEVAVKGFICRHNNSIHEIKKKGAKISLSTS
jgi:hypothetical protein